LGTDEAERSKLSEWLVGAVCAVQLHAMVNIFVGVTDKDWFDFLSTRAVDEVNFWAPSGRTNLRALRPGELFLFKLHSPDDFIVGGGIFSHGSLLPLSIAWEAFGEKNGVATREEMRRRIGRYRADDDPRSDPTIGCRILTTPFFWPRELWMARRLRKPGPCQEAIGVFDGLDLKTGPRHAHATSRPAFRRRQGQAQLLQGGCSLTASGLVGADKPRFDGYQAAE
jgi:hypothetical protein